MYHVLKKYKKRLLAVFTAALMVAFLIPTVGRMGRTPGSIVRGRIGDQKIYLSEYQAALGEFDLLTRGVLLKQGNGRGVPPVYILGEMAVSQMVEHPELYLLLQKEAVKVGAFVPPQEVQQLYDDCELRALKNDYGAEQQLKLALTHLLMINSAFRDVASTVKISAPYRDYELATRLQQMKISAVEFDAAEVRSKVGSPTEQQLADLYNRYADVLPEAAARDPQANPFEIAYKFPRRVKLQYLYVPYAEVRKSVEAQKSAYDWNVAAAMYYKTHPELFTSTTRPAGASATAPTTRVLKPFPAVQKEALDAVILPEVDRRQVEIQRFVNATMPEDYNAFKAAGGATRPTSLSVPYNDYAYLQKLAAELQKRFQVTARIESFSGLQSQQDLARNEALARAGTQGGVSLPVYALLTQEEYDKLQRRMPALPRPMELWQPSQALTDDEKGLWYFRLTEIDPERRAHGLAEVRETVERDWRLMESTRLATQAADDFLTAARAQGFDAAAKAAKKPVMNSDFFSRGGRIMGLHLEDALADRFASEATTLLARKAAGDNPAMASIQLARQGRVFAARLDEVRSDLPAEEKPYAELLATSSLRGQLERQLQNRWYDYANVVSRLQYKDEGIKGAVPVQGPTNPADWPQL